MAWAIQTERGGGYLVLGTPYQPVIGDTITWGGSVNSGGNTYQFFCNTYTSANDWINLNYVNRLNCRINGVNKTGSTTVTNNTYFEFKLEVTTTEYIFYIDNVEQFRFSNATAIDPIVSLSAASAVLGVDSKAQFLTVAGKHHWDASASDHSNTGAQPVLLDAIGGNNATGVNFATDGSAWVDLGGGAITGSIAFDIVKPVFSVSGAATLPNPISTIDFNVSKPLFASSGAASLPQPSGTIDFNVDKPLFNITGAASLPFPIATISFDVSSPTFTVTGAATLPNPSGNIDFTISKPAFSISGAASLPQPIASISFDIDKPTFSAVGSATIPYPQGVVSFDISKPVFAATGVATLPDPVGNIDFTIASPIFLGAGSVSGFIIPTGSIIKVSYGSNMIQLPYTSNTIKL